MNRLQHETSPYLLQHKDNPVDWYAWKPEALERAKRENKPILVSIGYSTCHWCHVMEKESFEDESTAEIMNENFVCIKIDREERPDLDQIYMEACQIISGNGGWPLNCFLLPDGRPYFAGTYYPPASAYNRPSWKQVLTRMADVFYTQPETVEDQAARLTDIIAGSGTALLKEPAVSLSREQIFSPVTLQQIFVRMHGRFDAENGGFGGAPKFPGAMSLRYLLQYAHFEKNPLALNHLLHSLEKMCRGGIYDLLGGGFARYTVDAAWLVPHFEKMLYDNALLVSLLSETVLKLRTLPGKEVQIKLFLDTIEETLTWVKREMTDAEGGFYSALDADSEGVEGKFYVWKKEEIENILGEDAALFCDYFDVSEEGNWEHNNILWRAKSLEELAAEKGLPKEDLDRKFSAQKAKLFESREQRIRPGLDDKILLDWNALMCSAYCKAFHATGKQEYKDIAIKNIDFLLKTFEKEDKAGFYHSFKEGKRQYEAFLNDYAFLIEALIDVYEVGFDTRYLNEAKRLSDYLREHFLDKADNLFYFTSEKQEDVVLRRKDLYDNAVPSGNSTMVRNLQKLGILFEIKAYKQLAAEMLVTIKETVESYPTSFARWANCLVNEVYSVLEVAVVGPEAEETALKVQQQFIPNKVLMASKKSDEAYPLPAHKADEETLIYVCRDYACAAPVQTVDDMMETLL